jgi:hypothetical protein
LLLKNKTNQLFLSFISCQLGRSRIRKEKVREREKSKGKILKKNPRKKKRKVRE